MILNLCVQRLTLFCVILLATAPIVSCDDVSWDDKQTHTITGDDDSQFSVGEYVVRATDFNGEGAVALEITQRSEEAETETDVVVKRMVLTKGEIWDNDEIRLECDDATDTDDLESVGRWPWSPEATIISWVAEIKKPDITITISTDDIEYLHTDVVTTEITIENDGESNLRDALLNISLDGLVPSESGMVRRIGTIGIDDSTSFTTKFRFTTPPRDGTIRVEVSGTNEDGVPYSTSESQEVTLKPPLDVRKFATPDICWGEKVYVTLVVRNVWNYRIESVTLNGEVPDQFRVDGNSSLNRTFDLAPNEEWRYQYYLVPEIPGSFTLPAASASWSTSGERYESRSDRPEVVVHGAFIDVAKTVDPAAADIAVGGTTNVTIVIENTGDLPATITLMDRIPTGASYVSGTTNLTTHLRARESETLGYVMRIDAPDTTIPEPTLEFAEILYDRRTIDYTGNYRVTMPTAQAQSTASHPDHPDQGVSGPDHAANATDAGIGEEVGSRNTNETMNDVTNETTLRRINVGAKEVKQKIESLKEVPGFEGTWLIAIIMIVYAAYAFRRTL